MVYEEYKELKDKQTQLLAELRNIVGNKKLEFSKAYIVDRRKGEYHRLGNGYNMPYYGVTRQSVMCPCRVVYKSSEDGMEFGAYIMKYSLYRDFEGQIVKKIPLEDLFVKDLEQIVDEIKFFLWWENEVHYPQIKKEYEETLTFVEKYKKLNK